MSSFNVSPVAEHSQRIVDYQVLVARFDESATQQFRAISIRPLCMVVVQFADGEWLAYLHAASVDAPFGLFSYVLVASGETLADIGGPVAAALSEATDGAWPAGDPAGDFAEEPAGVAADNLGSEHVDSPAAAADQGGAR